MRLLDSVFSNEIIALNVFLLEAMLLFEQRALGYNINKLHHRIRTRAIPTTTLSTEKAYIKREKTLEPELALFWLALIQNFKQFVVEENEKT